MSDTDYVKIPSELIEMIMLQLNEQTLGLMRPLAETNSVVEGILDKESFWKSRVMLHKPEIKREDFYGLEDWHDLRSNSWWEKVWRVLEDNKVQIASSIQLDPSQISLSNFEEIQSILQKAVESYLNEIGINYFYRYFEIKFSGLDFKVTFYTNDLSYFSDSRKVTRVRSEFVNYINTRPSTMINIY